MKSLNIKSTLNLGVLSISVLLYASTSQASDNEIVDQLKSCARMGQDSNRIDCYEQLGKSVINDDTRSPVNIANTPSQTEAIQAEAIQTKPAQTDVLPDNLGGGDFSDKTEAKVESNRGHVTSCQKASDRKWFYIFENGQAWKQVDSRKRHHKNCDFMVTITKDSFGYKMVIDGQDSKIRIDRRR